MKLKNINIHKLIEILIITAGVSVMLLALTVWIFDLTNYFKGDWEDSDMDPDKAVTVNVEKEIPLGDLEKVIVDLSFSDIHVVTGKSETLSLKFSGSIISRPDLEHPYLLLEERGKTLTLKPAMVSSYSVYQSKLLLELTIPEKQLNRMELNTSSGDIVVEGSVAEHLLINSTSGAAAVSDFRGSSLSMDSSSGDMSVNDSSTDELNVETTSGDMEINSSDTGIFAADTSSGEVVVESLESEENRVETTSGKALLSNLSGNLEYQSSSGSLNVLFSREGDSIIAETTSGDVIMSFGGDADFRIIADTTSGDFSIDFPLTLDGDWSDDHVEGKIGDGTGLIRIKTSSGDISIVKR